MGTYEFYVNGLRVLTMKDITGKQATRRAKEFLKEHSLAFGSLITIKDNQLASCKVIYVTSKPENP